MVAIKLLAWITGPVPFRINSRGRRLRFLLSRLIFLSVVLYVFMWASVADLELPWR